MNINLISLIVADRSFPFHTDINDERIQSGEITNHDRIDIQQISRKVLAGGKLYGRIRMCLVMGTVVRIQSIIDRILCQFGMQFAALTVRSFTVVVIDTIGDIARLLDFSDETTGSDGVYTARRQEENIARIHIVTL